MGLLLESSSTSPWGASPLWVAYTDQWPETTYLNSAVREVCGLAHNLLFMKPGTDLRDFSVRRTLNSDRN